MSGDGKRFPKRLMTESTKRRAPSFNLRDSSKRLLDFEPFQPTHFAGTVAGVIGRGRTRPAKTAGAIGIHRNTWYAFLSGGPAMNRQVITFRLNSDKAKKLDAIAAGLDRDRSYVL